MFFPAPHVLDVSPFMSPSLRDCRANAWAWALPLLLILLFLVYLPGLSGTFLLDDHINLDRLGEFGGVDNWTTAATYLFGGHLEGFSRPISLASFLLDDFTWPSDPYSFKYTNVLFHLLVTTVVTAFALQLARAVGLSPGRRAAVAVLTAAIWGLHPYLVSTVLYVVQRMTILSALFVLAGLTAYLTGRMQLAEGRSRPAYVYMSLGVAVFTPLAFLSKANGALLPLLALVLEFTVLSRTAIGRTPRPVFRAWQGLFLWLPLALMAGYFAFTWQETIVQGYLREALTLKGRLLTEPRILFDYVANLIAPRIQTSGLLHDHYHAHQSTGLLSPPSTLPSLLGIVAAFGLAIVYRRRWPLLAATILFFLAAHLLESSFIPLELYFEHRNYLPAVLPAFAAAVGLTALPRKQAAIASMATVLLLSSFTALRADLWGRPHLLILTWAEEAPTSVRAAQYKTLIHLDRGEPWKARRSLEHALEQHPNHGLLRLQHLVMLCVTRDFTPAAAERTLEALRDEPLTQYVMSNIDKLAQRTDGQCGEFDTVAFIDFLERFLAQPGQARPPGFVEDIGFLHGLMKLRLEDFDGAAASFRSAAEATRSLPATMRMAAELASAGAHEHALSMLDRAERYLDEQGQDLPTVKKLRRSLSQAVIDYRAEIERLRRLIRERRDAS